MIQFGELHEFLEGNITTAINYSRYWHGYMPFYRILLIFFNISQLRVVLLIIFIILFILLMHLINKRIGWVEALIFGFAFFIDGYFSAWLPLGNAPIFIVMMIASVILLIRIDKIKDIYMFIFIIACISSYIDYLTVPLITLAIPLVIYILYNQKINKELDYKYYIKLVIKSSIIWIIGYGLAWFSKWCIYDIVYNGKLIKSAISQIFYRSSRSNLRAVCGIENIGTALILMNIYNAFLIMLIVLLAYAVSDHKTIDKTIKRKSLIKNILPFLLISLMPIAWYLILANHTVLHEKFVYRHMIIFLISICVCYKKILFKDK